MVPSQLDSSAEDVQVRLLRSAGTTRRAALGFSLSNTVIALAREAIRRRNPRAVEREVLLAFAAVHYGEELAGCLREHLERRNG